jgi:molybdopterin-guanine dinucleotide biosynthesis protein A
MGRDKAALPFRGSTLVEAVAETVRSAAGTAALVGGSFPAEMGSFGFVLDLYPGEGPLGGILTALQSTHADWNLIVACDMPALSGDFLGQLMDAAEDSQADVLVPIGPSGRLEPLCAVYRQRALAGLDRAFARGVRKVAMALEEVRLVTLAVPESSYFQNVNTPQDWATYDR